MKFYSWRWKLWHWTVDKLIALAKRTPYFHLHHGDGTLYMERYWLIPWLNDVGSRTMSWWREPFGWLCQRFGIAMRIHVLHTPDLDRALHDHPWDYISVVLRGYYTELRPVFNDKPCFEGYTEEAAFSNYRDEGSIAYRHATDRHRIVRMGHQCVTLFITGPKRQWWGFYIPSGKVYYKDYDSVHNKVPIGRNELRGEHQEEGVW